MKLNVKQTILVGLAFASISAFWTVYDGIIPLILTKTFEMGDTFSGTVMAMDNVLALFLLPFFGALSDKTNTKIGKRMPFILFGTTVAVIFMMVLPFANQVKNFMLFMVGLGCVLLAMSTFRSPAVALMPDVTPKELRSKGNAIINLMGTVGGIAMLATISLLVPKGDAPNYFPLFATTAAFMIICTAILFLTIKEREITQKIKVEESENSFVVETDGVNEVNKSMPKDVMRSLILILLSVFFWFMGYNAVITAFSRYANTVWGLEGGAYANVLMIAQVAAVIAYVPVGAIASKIGRKKTILIGVLMLLFSFGVATFFKTFSTLVSAIFVIAGMGWAFINVNSYPMVVEMSNSTDVGKYTGYYYTFSMAAQIITPILSGAVMEYVGYQFLFPYSTICVIVSFITMTFVKHGDNRPGLKSGIEAFDIDDE